MIENADIDFEGHGSGTIRPIPSLFWTNANFRRTKSIRDYDELLISPKTAIKVTLGLPPCCGAAQSKTSSNT